MKSFTLALSVLATSAQAGYRSYNILGQTHHDGFGADAGNHYRSYDVLGDTITERRY